MSKKNVVLSLTDREADALHGVLSVVLNDPDWFEGDRDHAATVRASDKLVRAIREKASTS